MADDSQHGGWRDKLSLLRSLFIFTPLIWLYTLVLATLSLISSLFDGSGRVQHGFARFWSWLILKTAFCPLAVRGLENLDSRRARVYAANHLSALDIPVLYAGLPIQFRIMAKRELFRYPALGWHLKRSGQVAVDVEDVDARDGSGEKITVGKITPSSVRNVLAALNSGRSLAIFPEGGRSKTGRVKPFMSGAFYFAIRAGVDVVPMAIVGTYQALRMNSFHIRPRRLELVIGKPIPTTGYSTRQAEELAARVQKEVEEMLDSHSERSEEALLEPERTGRTKSPDGTSQFG